MIWDVSRRYNDNDDYIENSWLKIILPRKVKYSRIIILDWRLFGILFPIFA